MGRPAAPCLAAAWQHLLGDRLRLGPRLAKARVLGQQRPLVEPEIAPVGCEEAARIGFARHLVPAPLLERAQIPLANLRLAFDCGQVDALTLARSSQAGADLVRHDTRIVLA